MIISFRDRGTEDIFEGRSTKRARNTCPQSAWRAAGRKLDQLDSVTRVDQLRVPRGNEFESLKGDRKGQHSIRINKQYRICFLWTDRGPVDVEITDYH